MSMSDKEKKERKDIRVEIKARKIVMKKLDTAIKALEQTCARERKEKEEKREKLLSYKSYQDAQDAYGWGYITEEEFDEITEFMESSQKLVDESTAEDIAVKTLKQWHGWMTSEIAELEFQLLPEKEQKAIRQRNMELWKKRAEHERSNQPS